MAFEYKVTYVFKYKGRFIKNVKYFTTLSEAKSFLKEKATIITTSTSRKERIKVLWKEDQMADAESIRGVNVNDADIDTGKVLIYDGAELVYAIITAENIESLTADRAIITNASGIMEPSTITADEIFTLSGIASNIQTQLNAKLDEHSEEEGATLCSDGDGGIQAGPRYIDTSIGKNSFTFPGHYAQVMEVYNAGAVAIEAGDLVCLIGTTSSTTNYVTVMDASHGAWRPYGVAVEAIATSASGDVAIKGFVDAKCNGSTTVVRELFSASNTVGAYNKVQATWSNASVGLSCARSGSNYYNDGTDLWVRLELCAQESS